MSSLTYLLTHTHAHTHTYTHTHAHRHTHTLSHAYMLELCFLQYMPKIIKKIMKKYTFRNMFVSPLVTMVPGHYDWDRIFGAIL